MENDDLWCILKLKGNELFKQEKWKEAMKCYSTAVKINDKEAVLFSNRAICHLKLQEFLLAHDDANSAIALDPSNIKFYRILSEALVGLELYLEGLSACDDGLVIDPLDQQLLERKNYCAAIMSLSKEGNLPFTEISTTFKLQETVKENDQTLKLILNFLPMTEGNVTIVYAKREDVETLSDLDVKKFKNVQKTMQKAHSFVSYGPVRDQNLAEALKLFEVAAKHGNADGLYNLGRMYMEGKGCLQDHTKGIELFKEAAAQKPFHLIGGIIAPNVGVAESISGLGITYLLGTGVEKNLPLSYQHHMRSAELGCVMGQNNLGLSFLTGSCCEKDENKARYWFGRAAGHGYAAAQVNYADMIQMGLGGPADPHQAAKLYRAAADRGLPEAMLKLQQLLRSGVFGATASNCASSMLSEAVKNKDTHALHLLGENYFQGEGGEEKNLELAQKYWEEATALGHVEAEFKLAKLLLEKKENAEALKHLQIVADIGTGEAQYLLGELYAYGHGCSRDENLAKQWLGRAKHIGFSLSLDDVKKSIEKVIEFGRKVVDYEKVIGISFNGLTLKERRDRYLKSRLPAHTMEEMKINDNLIDAMHSMSSGEMAKLERELNVDPNIDIWMPKMKARAEKGSVIATSLFKALNLIEDAKLILFLGGPDSINLALKIFRHAFVHWGLLFMDVSLIRTAAKKALDKDPNDANALFANAVLIENGTAQERLWMMQRCVKLDPNLAIYHEFLGNMYAFTGDYQRTLNCCETALNIYSKSNKSHYLSDDAPLHWIPQTPSSDCLYNRACAIRLLNGRSPAVTNVKVIKAIQLFLDLCPVDHRRVPDAYYTIGMIWCEMGDMNKAEEFWQKGQMSESADVRLPIYCPIADDFLPKCILKKKFYTKNIIFGFKTNVRPKIKEFPNQLDGNSAVNRGINKTRNKKANTNISSTTCSNCGETSGRLLMCSACQVASYCNKNCQRKHWSTHKISCIKCND